MEINPDLDEAVYPSEEVVAEIKAEIERIDRQREYLVRLLEQYE